MIIDLILGVAFIVSVCYFIKVYFFGGENDEKN
jgi:hypothetical protein